MLGLTGKDSAGMPLVTTITAILLGLLYIVAAWFMFDTFALHEVPKGLNYDRAAGIFAGIQSIGFAAIGVLLGVAVQQPRVADAKAGEKKAKDAIRSVIANSGGGEDGGAISANMRAELHSAL